MLLEKLLPVSALLFALCAACGSNDDDKKEAPPVARPEIPLNAPTDILGSWTQCRTTAESKSSVIVYSFEADGSLESKTEVFNSSDCSGAALVSVVYKGSYLVGSGNALDITFPIGEPKDNQLTTQYRTFSVQGTTLLISNNAGPGADAEHRDYDLNSNSLKLAKLAP